MPFVSNFLEFKLFVKTFDVGFWFYILGKPTLYYPKYLYYCEIVTVRRSGQFFNPNVKAYEILIPKLKIYIMRLSSDSELKFPNKL